MYGQQHVLTASVATRAVMRIRKFAAQVPDGEGQVALDQLLVGSLFNKKEPQAAGDAHPRADVLHRLLGKLLLFTHVVRPTETVRAVADHLR